METTHLETNTLPKSVQMKLNKLNKLFGGKLIHCLLKELILKKFGFISNEVQGQSTSIMQQAEPSAEWDNWDAFSKSTHIDDLEDCAKIEAAYFEIKDIGKEQLKFIAKEISFIPFEDAYKFGTILDFLPVTSQQIIDRNRQQKYKELDPEQPHIATIDIKRRKFLRQLPKEEAKSLYQIEENAGKKIYKVNLARLVQMSARKKHERYRRTLEVRLLRPRKKEQEENMRREAQLKQSKMDLISKSADEDEEEYGSILSKKVHKDQDENVKNQFETLATWYKELE